MRSGPRRAKYRARSARVSARASPDARARSKRLLAELLAPARGGGVEGERERQASEQLRAERHGARGHDRERLFEQCQQRGIRQPDLRGEGRGVAHHRLGEERAVDPARASRPPGGSPPAPRRSRSRARAHRRAAGSAGCAFPHPMSPKPIGLDGLPEVGRRLLVGEPGERLLTRGARVRRGLGAAVEARARGEMVRELGKPPGGLRRPEGLELLADASVQSHALGRREVAVDRLADERVREPPRVGRRHLPRSRAPAGRPRRALPGRRAARARRPLPAVSPRTPAPAPRPTPRTSRPRSERGRRR